MRSPVDAESGGTAVRTERIAGAWQMVIEYVRYANGETSSVATPQDIEIARRYMRADGIESLPILRGNSDDGSEVDTGLWLRANVAGVLLPKAEPGAAPRSQTTAVPMSGDTISASLPAREPRRFVVINDSIFYLRNERDVAQDAMAEAGIASLPIHYDNGKCGRVTVTAKRSESVSLANVALTPLEACERLLQHFGKDCRYEEYEADEKLVISACATALSRLVVERHDDILVARVFIAIPYTKQYSDDHGEACYAIVRARSVEHGVELATDAIDDECWWSKEANAKGDTVESAGDGVYYHMWSCDCGDEGCQDENTTHESQTETILFRLDEAVAYPTREAAVTANVGRDPAVEYLET